MLDNFWFQLDHLEFAELTSTESLNICMKKTVNYRSPQDLVYLLRTQIRFIAI